MARPLRRRYGAFYTEALLRVCRSAIARRLRKRYVATPTEALARRLGKRSGETHAHGLWRETCGSSLVRRLRKRYGASSTEAL